MSLNLQRIRHEFREYLADQSFALTLQGVGYMVHYDEMESNFTGESVIQPNKGGIFLLAVWYHFVVQPLGVWRYATCDHPNLEDESYGGPESGCMAASCPDCGWHYHHTLY